MESVKDRQPLELDRRFEPAGERPEFWQKAKTWDEILQSPYVVVLGEGGMGKTTELKLQAKKRRKAGEVAFFVEIGKLAMRGLDLAMGLDDAPELTRWRGSEEPALFLLDSLDEAKLRSQFLPDALENLRRALGEAWPRARLVISSRASDWMASSDLRALEEAVAAAHPERVIGESESPPLIQVVQLAPLDRRQIELLARRAGVTDFEALWNAIWDNGAHAFTERPVDVDLLAAYWEEHQRLDSLTDLIEFSLRKRLQERDGRASLGPSLSLSKSRQGVTALAGIALLERRWAFLVPDDEVDPQRLQDAIIPKEVLNDWDPADVKALLRLPIFDEATYGRVRLHHRTVHEYLAARWFEEILEAGWPYHELEALLLRRETTGTVVPAHLQAVAAWLAGWRDELADRLVAEAPELLLHHGDPARLPEPTRRAALHAFAQRYDSRKRLGQWFSAASLRRFACAALVPLVDTLLCDRGQPEELRSTLLELVEHGELGACAAAALTLACDIEATSELRKQAIQTLGAVGGPKEHAELLAALPENSSTVLVGATITALYPKALATTGLIDLTLRATGPNEHRFDEVHEAWSRLLSRTSENEHFDFLSELCRRLTPFPADLDTNAQPWCCRLLAEVVLHVLERNATSPWHTLPPALASALEVLRLASQRSSYGWSLGELVRHKLDQAPALRRHLFWYGVTRASDGGLSLANWQSIPHQRELFELRTSDIEWLSADAGSDRPLPERLLAFNRLYWIPGEAPGLERIAAQSPALRELLEELQQGQRARALERENLPEFRRWREQEQVHQRELEATRLANLEVLTTHLDEIRRGTRTDLLIHLYQEAEHAPSRNSKVGVEPLRERYGNEIAEAAELGWRAFWRQHTPKLPHERTTTNKIDSLDIVGLAGLSLEIQAGADISRWTEDEARLAARYASCEIDGLPAWIEALALTQPAAVREALEPALRAEYEAPLKAFHSCPLLDALGRRGPYVLNALRPVIVTLLQASETGSVPALKHCLNLATQHPIACPPPPLELVTERCRAAASEPARFAVWMQHWLDRQADEATAELCKLPPAAAAALVPTLLAQVGDDSRDPSHRFPRSLEQNGSALLRLLPQAYSHVRAQDDLHHQGAYSPSARDHAQRSRDRLLSRALDPALGVTVADLRQLADNPHLAAVRDLILTTVERRTAIEAAEAPCPSAERLLTLYRERGTAALQELERRRAKDATSPITAEGLLGDVVAIGQSLLERKVMLPEEEDKINDWLLDLLRHRLHYRRVEVGDQARGGMSAGKGKATARGGVGERDGVLRHQGKTIGVFEAFRQPGLDASVIKKHLDKLPGYNPTGAPLFVAAYYQGRHFGRFARDYVARVEAHPLGQWRRRNQPSDYPVDHQGAALRVLRFVYDTGRGEQVVFHVLLDLGDGPNVKKSRAARTSK